MNEFELILAILKSIDKRLLELEEFPDDRVNGDAFETLELIDRLSNVIPKGDPR